MFIINPLAGRGADNLFSTHPATGNRVRALMELGAKMGIQSRARTPDLTQPRPAAGFTTTGVPTTPTEPRGPWG